MNKICVIDVGSNTVKAYVYDAKLNIIAHKNLYAQLMNHISDGILTEKGINLLIDCISELKAFSIANSVSNPLCFATAAVRSADNSEEISARVKKACGLDIEIISGSDEALCDCLSAKRFSGEREGVALDIGGGSGQISVFDEAGPKSLISYPIGGLKLKEQFVSGDIPTKEEYDKITAYVTELIYPAYGNICTDKLILMGGSSMALANMLLDTPAIPFSGAVIMTDEINTLAESLLSDAEAALAYLKLKAPGREKAFLCAAAAYKAVTGVLKASSALVLTQGVREGYIIKRGIF